MNDPKLEELKAKFRSAWSNSIGSFDPSSMAAVESARAELRAFYLAGGHDLTELTRLFQETEQSSLGYLPS